MRKRKGNRVGSRARDRPQAIARERPERLVTAPQGMPRPSAQMRASDLIYSAVSLIAGAMALIPMHLYIGDRIAVDDPRETLVALRPNRRQSAYLFRQGMEIARCTEGRAYAVKQFDGLGNLSGLCPIDPARVTPLEDEATGDIWFHIVRDDGVSEFLHNWYVLSFFHASTNGVTGIRVADVLAESVVYNREVKAFSLANLKAVNRGIVLEFPAHLNGERRKNSVKEFVELYHESDGQVIALESGVKASSLTMSPLESGTKDAESITRGRVEMVYGLPPGMLGGGTMTSEMRIAFLTSPIQGACAQWEAELNWKLLSPQERRQGYEFRSDLEAYLRADASARADIAQKRVRTGLRTINEIRREENMPPAEGGDVLMISKDLAPVTLVAAGATVDLSVINGEHNAAKGGT